MPLFFFSYTPPLLSPPLFPDAGPGRAEPKCAPDIGKPILLADAVVIIDYYLDSLHRRADLPTERGPRRVERGMCALGSGFWKHFFFFWTVTAARTGRE